MVKCVLIGGDPDLPGDLTDTVLRSRGVVSGVLSTDVIGVVLVLLPSGKLLSERSITASFCCFEVLQTEKKGQRSHLLLMASVIIDGNLSTKYNNLFLNCTDGVNTIDLRKELLPSENRVSCFVNVNF